MKCEGWGPANLLTKGQAWHTHNIVRIDVLLPAHTPTDLLGKVRLGEEGSSASVADTTLSGRGGSHEVFVDGGDRHDRRSFGGRLCQSDEI